MATRPCKLPQVPQAGRAVVGDCHRVAMALVPHHCSLARDSTLSGPLVPTAMMVVSVPPWSIEDIGRSDLKLPDLANKNMEHPVKVEFQISSEFP